MDSNGIRRIGGGVVLAGGLVGFGFGVAGAGAAQVPTARVVNGTLSVTGTSGEDDIAVRQTGSVVEVDFDADGTADRSFDAQTFTEIVVASGPGDDHLRFDRASTGLASFASTLDGGSGDDTLDGGPGAQLLLGGSGNDVVAGGDADDVAELGSGRDSFRWDPGDDNDTIDGGSGRDTMLFIGANVAEEMRLSANGERALFERNIASIRMDTVDVERLDLQAKGGADTVTIDDMSGTDFERAHVDVGASDGLEDKVTVKGTDDDDDIRVDTDDAAVEVTGLPTVTDIAGAEPTDQLQVNAGAGDDTIRVTEAAEALMKVTAIFS